MPQRSYKDWTTALILSIFLGPLGVHRFYVNKIGTGILWLLTGGCFGIGWLVDVIMIANETFTDDTGCVLVNEKKYVDYSSPQYGQYNAPQNPDYIDQLSRLADLRDKGIITEAEFNEKKAVVMNKFK